MARKTKKKSRPKPPRTVEPADAAIDLDDADTIEVEIDSGTGDRPAIPSTLPILPVRGMVMLPGTITPIAIGRPSSQQLLDESLPKSKIIGLFTQRDEDDDEPDVHDIYDVGCAGLVLKLIRQPDEPMQILVHGLGRVRITSATRRTPYLRARVRQVREKPGTGKRFAAAINQLRDQARELIEESPNASDQAMTVLMNIEDPSALADFLVANLKLDVEQRQDLLEETDVAKRVRAVHRHVTSQLEIQKLQNKIQEDVQESIGQTQRKFYLREQLKAIQRELGEADGDTDGPIDALRERLLEADPPPAVLDEALKELDRLAVIPPASPEYSVITGYVELIADLPWSNATTDRLNLKKAREILDRDHFDLDKVKRRLIEFLAVRKLNPEGKGPILCLVGPPGVGKTSLGQSIADAMGRKFVRLALGGIRDEAEVRGHRRTYVGAMPGRIIQELKRAGTHNPVMMLDEIDKLGADFRGDPASALLEVLDPRQNHQFVDRYLDVPFDLSNVLFIATANYAGNIPPALMDRMETIDLPGYTDHDKLEIAKAYLVPRQLKEHGLKPADCRWLIAGIKKVIEAYTREAGVRELERQIGAVCRGVAAKVASSRNGRRHTVKVDAAKVAEMLGPETHRRELDTRTAAPGVVVGLAYTPVGGEILFIEATRYPGTGKVQVTGQLGDVMKESASAALSLVKSRAPDLGIDAEQLAESDLHIHVPAGAVPKDGPSAGVAMFTAIASLLLNKRVKSALAMTGEITLRGRVLPIGGVKEKSLAAARAGIKTVLLPADNERDLPEVDDKVKKKLTFKFIETVDDLLDAAL
ncbi:MAG: endopeptidase La [Planctomycetota bacterium]